MVTENGEPDALLTRTLINSTSLSGPFILNSFLSHMNPPQPFLPIYYEKGPYASCLGPGASNVQHLIPGAGRWPQGAQFRRVGDAPYSRSFREHPFQTRY